MVNFEFHLSLKTIFQFSLQILWKFLEPAGTLYLSQFAKRQKMRLECPHMNCTEPKEIMRAELANSTFECRLKNMVPFRNVPVHLSFFTPDFTVNSSGTNGAELAEADIREALRKSAARVWTLSCTALNPLTMSSFPLITPRKFTYSIQGSGVSIQILIIDFDNRNYILLCVNFLCDF